MWLLSCSTGALLAPACRAWFCEYCGPIRARRYAAAIDGCGYHRFLTFTRPPKDLRQSVSRLVYNMRRRDPVELAWTVERGSKTGMVHIHACARAEYIDYAHMRKAARRAGWGRVSHASAGTGQAAAYAAKAASYSAKASRSNYTDWLSWSGGRPWRFTSGYTGGQPVRDWVPKHAPAADIGPWRSLILPPTVATQTLLERWAVERASVPLREATAVLLAHLRLDASVLGVPSRGEVEWAAQVSGHQERLDCAQDRFGQGQGTVA